MSYSWSATPKTPGDEFFRKSKIFEKRWRRIRVIPYQWSANRIFGFLRGLDPFTIVYYKIVRKICVLAIVMCLGFVHLLFTRVNYSLGVHKKIGVQRGSKASKKISGFQRGESGVQKIAIVKMRIM